MNAKTELIEHVEDRTILCAKLAFEETYNIYHEVTLAPDYATNDYAQFLAKLDREYDEGYGGQELFGVIWYSDGTWSERGEYDGSEWWVHKECPSWGAYRAGR